MSPKRLGIALIALLLSTTVFADNWRDHRRERREDRRERREDRRERYEDRRERRDDRRDRRQDRRRPVWRDNVRDHRYNGPRRAPPAVRVERYRPRPGYVWVNGYWDWRGDNYVWISGRYERQRRGYRWRDRRWEQRDGAWIFVDGGWYAMGPASAPPAVRVERYHSRPGFIWVRGHWDWRGDQWVWIPGHYERERAGYYYREPTWQQRDGAWISVEGSWVIR